MAAFEAFLMSELRPRFSDPIYIDGSFVTDKVHPNDIDVVLDLTAADDATKWRGLSFWSAERMRIKSQYNVDFWPNLPGENDFCAFFQYVGVKTAKYKGLGSRERKGILRLL